jgi:uncharacterized protein YqeY
MTLLEKINIDLKQSMVDKNADVTSVLRMLISGLRNKEISLRKNDQVELSDEQTLAVLQSEIKKRKDSIEAYLAGARNDLAEKEKAEIKILEIYLPKQLEQDELENIVKNIISRINGASAKDFGRVMGAVMTEIKGRADGNMVGEIVKKLLV